MHRAVLRALLALVLLVGAGVADAAAQVDRIARRAKRQVTREIDKATDQAVKCALGDKQCAEKAVKEGKPVVITDENGEVITDENGAPVTDQDEAASRADEPGEGVWRNYDFVPGKRVLKVVSFDSSAVGRFPSELIGFGRGTMEVVELDGVRWLESKTNSSFTIELPEELGREFSLEFYLKVPTSNIGARVYFRPRDPRQRAPEEDYLDLTAHAGIYRQNKGISTTYMQEIVKRTVPIKLQVAGEYAILYVGTVRAGMLPTAKFPRSNTIEVQLGGNQRFPTYVGDFVVAVDLDDLGETLEAGKDYTTRGIYFDTDSDRLRPESTKALSDLLAVLERSGSLRVAIEGHTDAEGETDYNQQLSERRATAVVDYLTKHGIERSRMRPVGKGVAVPAASNVSPEGRQENRRVVVMVLTES
ncbi:MAG: OmpA family protein [Gemmatimonadales bacterium]